MPFTPDQCASFNAYQQSGVFHPFTCPASHPEGRDLVAREDGLFCPVCDYTQGWAHGWMLDWTWKRQQDAQQQFFARIAKEQQS